MNNETVRVEFKVNGEVKAFWVSFGTTQEVLDFQKMLDIAITNSTLWSVSCPMSGRMSKCSSREHCHHQ